MSKFLLFLIVFILPLVSSDKAFAYTACTPPPSGSILTTSPAQIKTGDAPVIFTVKSPSLSPGTKYTFKVDGNNVNSPLLNGTFTATYDAQKGITVQDTHSEIDPFNPLGGFNKLGYGAGKHTLSIIASGTNSGCDIPFDVLTAPVGGVFCNATILTQPKDAVPGKPVKIVFQNTDKLDPNYNRRIVVKNTDVNNPTFNGDQFTKTTECQPSKVFTDPNGYSLDSLPLGTQAIGLQSGCDPAAYNLCYATITITNPDSNGQGSPEGGAILPTIPQNKLYYRDDMLGFLNNDNTTPKFEPCPMDNGGGFDSKGNCRSVNTGLGISIKSDPASFAATLLGLFLGVGGLIMLFIIIITGYRLMTSQGDPEKVKAAREQLTGAIAGLVFMIFSIAILAFIGINLLHIPQFLP